MTTQNKENYGRDVRSFHHPEDDMKLDSDIPNQDSTHESYVDQYESDNDDEEIVNQDDDIINNEDDDELNNQFSNAVEDNENDFYEDHSDDIDPDDDPGEDYENDSNLNNFAADNLKKDLLDLEYDIDQDLEESDPVNHPRNFKY
jgi:hypothetical protein